MSSQKSPYHSNQKESEVNLSVSILDFILNMECGMSFTEGLTAELII